MIGCLLTCGNPMPNPYNSYYLCVKNVCSGEVRDEKRMSESAFECIIFLRNKNIETKRQQTAEKEKKFLSFIAFFYCL